MIILCENGKRSVNIGGSDIWKAVYSTIVSCIGEKRNDFKLALDFLKSGKCNGEQGYEVARQINLIRDELSQFSPDKAVYDIDHPGLTAPWVGQLSPVITSCANLFTTADGEDLLYELVSILCYAKVAKTDVRVE